jgi:CRISPR-associated protein Cmr4
MRNRVKQYFFQALAPVHVGSGQSVGSIVDLPVARERATDYPILPASAIKGVLRDGRYDDAANNIFGAPPDAEKPAQAANLVLTDARLLFLPVRSFFGTFALLTSPTVIERWRRDAQLLAVEGVPPAVDVPLKDRALVIANSVLTTNNEGAKRQVILEDIDLEAVDLDKQWAEQVANLLFKDEEERIAFSKHVAVVDDDVFDYFARHGLEIIARVQLDSQEKTVKEGPWYEEAVPAEAIFSFFALADDAEYFSEIEKRPVLQLGGQGSIGRGMLRLLEVSSGH